MTYTVEPLDDHAVQDFDCGNDALTAWLKEHARHAKAQGTRTYVLVSTDASVVLGYFAIAPHLIDRDEMPRRIGRGAPRQVPAILLAKLAVDLRKQGRGLGRALLVRAFEVVVEVARRAGGKILVVDAIDETAVRFYEYHGLVAIPGNAARLVIKLSTIASTLGTHWP